MIAKMIDSTKNRYWDTVLEDVEFATNNTLNRTIKEYPSVMLFWVRQKGKIVDELEIFLDSENPNCDRSHDEIRKRALKNQEKAQNYNKK